MNQNKSPKVSICVITYNQRDFIAKCITSILEQAVSFDIEIIVGDDCSTDGTQEIIRELALKHPSIIKPIYQARNVDRGVTNFLAVHRAAKGEFVAHLDGDDYLLPQKLQKQADFLDKNPEYAVCWHGAVIVDSNGIQVGETQDLNLIYPNGEVSFSKMMRFAAVGVHSSLMYRRTARSTYNPDFPTMDLFYSLEYLTRGKGKLLNEKLGAYRMLGGTLSARSNLVTRYLGAAHISHFYKLYPSSRKDVFIYAMTNALIDLKNKRRSFIVFVLLSLRSFCLISPVTMINHFRLLRLFKVGAPPAETNPSHP